MIIINLFIIYIISEIRKISQYIRAGKGPILLITKASLPL